MDDKNRGVRTPVQQRSKDKKERLIQAAFNLVIQKGFLATGIREIIKEADVSTGTYYAYFKDKSEIYLEIIKLMSADFFDVFADSVVRKLPEAEDVEALIYLIIDLLHKQYQQAPSLHREIMILTLTDTKFNELYNQFRVKKVEPLFEQMMDHFGNRLAIRNKAASMIVIFRTIEEICKHLVFNPSHTDPELIKTEAATMIAQFLNRTTGEPINRSTEKPVRLNHHPDRS